MEKTTSVLQSLLRTTGTVLIYVVAGALVISLMTYPPFFAFLIVEELIPGSLATNFWFELLVLIPLLLGLIAGWLAVLARWADQLEVPGFLKRQIPWLFEPDA